ncbi:MAG: MATE family efflux transporter [Firmicutes bacterium]|nr:MATE family efflux transporter [Bacillota bacterium]
MKIRVSRDRTFYRTVAVIAIPIIAQQLIMVGVNIMDTIMVARLGEAQIAGSSLANQFISIYQVMCLGIGVGATVLTARYWGAGRIDLLKKSVTIMLRIAIVLAVIFFTASLAAPRFIMSIYTNEDPIIAEGAVYLRWSAVTFFLTGVCLPLTQVLRSFGVTKVSLIASIGAFFINIFFNYVFIFGKLGFPRLEIAGAALGTLIARFFEFLFVGIYFFHLDKKIGYKVKDIFTKCGDLVNTYVQLSVPPILSDFLLALGNNVVSVVMGHIGGSFVAANAVAVVVMRVITVFTGGLSTAACIVTGQNLGKGEFDKMQEQGNSFFLIGAGIGFIGAFVIKIISAPMIRYYQLTEETSAIAAQMMNALCIIIIFMCINNILTKGVLRGGGDTKFLLLADVLFLWVLSIPAGYAAGIVLGLPAFWTYLALKLDQIVKAFWCLTRLWSGKWIKRVGVEKDLPEHMDN